MENQKIGSFSVIGISIRTTNEPGKASTDIPVLWHKFMSEGVINQIPNKIDRNLYCIYTDYEKDHTKPYTTILGCKVSSLNSIPPGLMGKTLTAGNYVKRTAKGNINHGIVFNAWTEIWNANIPRAFTADFEVYDERAQNIENAEVDIFVATI